MTVKFLYSCYTKSGLREVYPKNVILSSPSDNYGPGYGMVLTAPTTSAHILGRIQGRQRWWARWTEGGGRLV